MFILANEIVICVPDKLTQDNYFAALSKPCKFADIHRYFFHD